MKKTTIYLPEELDAMLERLAGREGASKAELIRAALRRYLEEAGTDGLPGSVGSIEDLGVSAADAKEWLRKNWPAEIEKAR